MHSGDAGPPWANNNMSQARVQRRPILPRPRPRPLPHPRLPRPLTSLLKERRRRLPRLNLLRSLLRNLPLRSSVIRQAVTGPIGGLGK